jgi:hypothetical protein
MAEMTDRTTRTKPRRTAVQHGVSLPPWYWTYLAHLALDQGDTQTRLIRIAIEEKYPEIKQAKEIGQ